MSIGTLELIMALAGAAGAGGSALSANSAGKRSDKQQARDIAAQKAARDQNTALSESALDPFRQQRQQAKAIGSLDMLEHADFSPRQIAPTARYAGSAPQMTGGFQYTPSADVRTSAGALKRNVMGGNTAPTMTDPMNYGKTAALDILSLSANGRDPGTMNAGSRPPLQPGGYLDGVSRRVGGRAATAGSDVSTAQARDILATVIRREQGREPNPAEIDALLASQGSMPGGQWVGEAGLLSLINLVRRGGHGDANYVAPAAPAFPRR